MSGIREFWAAGIDTVQFGAQFGLDPYPWQEKVLRSEEKRVLLNIHRQGGKSTIACILALHQAIYVPGSLVLMVSPSQRQSGRLFGEAMKMYRQLGKPVSTEIENQLSVRLENGSEIIALPGDEKTTRGYASVALLVIDEASRVDDALLVAVLPMLSISQGRLIAMSTPDGKRGWWYDASRDPSWDVTTVPATECPHPGMSEENLDTYRRRLGDWAFRQEYMCEFIDGAGRMFSTDDIEAIWTAGKLGAIPPGALYGTTPPEKRERPKRPLPRRPARCRRSSGHFWHQSHCIHCGIDQPEVSIA